MPNLRQIKKHLETALVILVVLDVLAVALYFSPFIGSAESRRQELNRLQVELMTKTRQLAPLNDLPHRVVLASHEISDFYARRFPSQNSQIYNELGKLALANGVTLNQVRYKAEENDQNNLQGGLIDADVTGNYTSLAKFINALERDEMFFIIEGVNLGGEQQGPVHLSMRLETFLKVAS